MPWSITTSPSAPGTRAAVKTLSGPLDLAGLPLREANRRPHRGEVEELLRVDARDLERVEVVAHEADRRRGRLAGVVPALESAHQDRALRAPAARSRSRPPLRSPYPNDHRRRTVQAIAELRRAPTRRRLRLQPQGPADRPQRHAPTSRSSCATEAAPSPRAPSATPTSSPASSSAATWCARPGASSASATSCRSSCARSGGWRRARPTRPTSCRWPIATSRSSTASSSTWRARSTTPTIAGCSTPFSPTPTSAPSCGAHRARAPGTTPTWAACSSTPWRWPRSRRRPACSTPG